MIRTTEERIVSLPPERPTTGHIRMFLSDIAMQYHTLATAALNGEYHTGHASFFATDGTTIGLTRLRALVHDMNTGFSQTMRDRGQKLKIGGEQYAEPTIKSLGPVHVFKRNKKNRNPPTHSEYRTNASFITEGEVVPSIVNHGQDNATEQECVTESDMREWVKKVCCILDRYVAPL
jgi:hypothetical protein